MAKSLIPKQWKLDKNADPSEFEAWVDCITFHFSIDPFAARFLPDGDLSKWDSTESRGFTNDDESHDKDCKMTAVAKKACLNLALGCISGNCTFLNSKFIKKNATSLNEIWDRIRAFLGFRASGARITEFAEFTMEPSESREALWERMYTFVEGNLLSSKGNIKHEGKIPGTDEEFTPTLLCILVSSWLHTIHPSLPSAVRQRFPIQLRDNTIYSIRNEISDAIPSILEEIEEKAGISRLGRFAKSKFPEKSFQKSRGYKKKVCCFCEAAGRVAEGHFLSQCPFLPPDDKRYMSKTRDINIESCDDSEDDDVEESQGAKAKNSNVQVRRVDIRSSPVVDAEVGPTKSRLLLDDGAEANLVTRSKCVEIGAKILPTSQCAVQADGVTPLKTVGETHFAIKLSHHICKFSGLVVEHLDSPIVAGIPFLADHDIYVRPSTRTVYMSECCSFQYEDAKSGVCKSRRAAAILRLTKQTCLLPGESVRVPVPSFLKDEDLLSIEPRQASLPAGAPKWTSCQILPVVDGCVEVENSSTEPVLISRHAQILQARPIENFVSAPPPPDLPKVNLLKSSASPHMSIKVDPSGILSKSDREKFHNLHNKYKDTFSPGIGLYNGYSGHFEHVINMSSSLPPQRKGSQVPYYNRHNKDALQLKCDELLAEGVFCRPEDVGISVTHTNTIFLVAKPDGTSRLVTSFGSLSDYILVPPTTTTNVEDVLRMVGQYKFVIKTDMIKAYFGVPMSKESMRYVGVNTPYKGTYVYTRSVMGLPGSEAALEELLCRILGDLVQSGGVIKLVDDLYLGANSVDELLKLWEEVLDRFHKNGLKLSPTKTVCCPTSTVILGWLWTAGSITPTSHRVDALKACDPPPTVKGLRSFIGVYKYMSRSLPFYEDILDPLEQACASHKSAMKIVWTDELSQAFEAAKKHLDEIQPVVVPRYNDQLHIVTDAAVRSAGIASAMYVVRDGKPVLAGHFNAKRQGSQKGWLPCEAEALSIGVSINHFAPYILQSDHQTRVMTDSKPCVQAVKKLQRGQYSNSARIQTFLSAVSRFKVEVLHVPGKNNILADFASRNPITCENPESCQICLFVSKLETCVVGHSQIQDILSKKATIPYTSRAAWLDIQKSCPDLMKVQEYLRAGISPQGNKRGDKDIRRYMNCVKLSTSPNDGLMVVKRSDPFQKSTQRIVIPRNVAKGLLISLHLELDHPSIHQMQQVFQRSFFMLDMYAAISDVVNHCHTCAALKLVPASFSKQTTSVDIKQIGAVYGADVLKDSGQCILVVRESISSYTTAAHIPNEKAESLRDGLTSLISGLRSAMSPPATIRTDPASGLRALVNDAALKSLNLAVELGDAKNANKNPVAEKAIEELRAEMVRINPSGGKISVSVLARALLNLNSRIRHNKLSAFEIWTQREMTTGNQIQFSDEAIVSDKINQRLSQHESSAKYKARGKTTEVIPAVEVGDIVYIWQDRNKSKSRDRYLVVEIDKDRYLQVQKFTGNQIRARKYRVKPSDVYSIQSDSSQMPPSPSPSLPAQPERQPVKAQIPVRSREFKRRKNKPERITEHSSDSSSDEFCISDLLPASLKSNHSEDQEIDNQEDQDIDNEEDQEIDNQEEQAQLPQVINQRPVRAKQQPDRYQADPRPDRIKKPPAYLKDFDLGNSTALPNSDSDELDEPPDSE